VNALLHGPSFSCHLNKYAASLILTALRSVAT
jgi:hypothetical protein